MPPSIVDTYIQLDNYLYKDRDYLWDYRFVTRASDMSVNNTINVCLLTWIVH